MLCSIHTLWVNGQAFLELGRQEHCSNLCLHGPRVERIVALSFDLFPDIHVERRIQVAVGFVFPHVIREVWIITTG